MLVCYLSPIKVTSLKRYIIIWGNIAKGRHANPTWCEKQVQAFIAFRVDYCKIKQEKKVGVYITSYSS